MPSLYIQVWQSNTERKAIVWKYFCIVKVTQYMVYKEDRKYRHEIWVLKLGNPFSQTSSFVPGRQNRYE